MKTEFRGDEGWDLEEIMNNSPEKNSFFYGWFDNKKGKIFEGGCGTGNFIVALSKKGFKVTGLEIDPERIVLAKENCKKYKISAKVIEGDLRKIPLKEEFDLIFCHGAVEHFPETQQALNELFRILKPKGLAMISVPARYSSFILLKYGQIISDKIFGTSLWNCGYERSFSPWKFKKMLEKAGFKVLDTKITQSCPGKRWPFIGKIERVLDKPFWLLGIGGRFMHFWCLKE